MPIYFVLLLALIRWLTTPKPQPAIEKTAAFSLDNQLFSSEMFLLMSPDTANVRQIAPELVNMLHLNSSPGYQIFPSNEESEKAYIKNGSTKSPSLVGIHFSDGTPSGMMNYTIRMPYGATPLSQQMYTGGGECREAEPARKNCLANTYLYSGFTRIQVAIDTLLVQMTAPGPVNLTRPQISVQMLPKTEWKPNVSTIQALASIYFVLAYSPFISFLSVNLVYEKEKKLKEAMRMMGMRDSAFWLAWGTVYTVMILLVTAVVVLLAFVARFFEQSNLFIFYLILFLYGLSIVNLSFALTPFFQRSETAGGLSSLATILLSMLYLAVRFAQSPTGESYIPLWAQYLLCLLSPVALALAVDQTLSLDILHGGLTFETINQGTFPVSGKMIMLFVDIVLYGLLAFYLDNIIPNEFGFRRKPWFFLQPSYWCPKQAHDPEQFSLIGGDEFEGTQADATPQTENMEVVSPEFRKKNMLRIYNLKKTYKTKEKKEVNAVDGFSLDIYEGQITALLGHNGAGKTTLLNMLTGMTPPTSGTASVYGLDVSDTSQLNVLRTMIGYCPQHNILFDDLTSREHLEYYGVIKGVQQDKLQQEVDSALKHVDLFDQGDTMSKQLSGGQKRKACVAIALIGNPKVMFLDEPTAGMDPASRRHLWRLLQQQRDKLIVLTTHFMDEADILADRKAMISKGKLRCVGSSLFLKVRFGVGYHLSMVLEPSADFDRIVELVKSHVPDAEYNRQHGKELIIRLPITAVSAFPDLFAALEAKEGDASMSKLLGIQTYGISMTNLEEVFLKLGQEAEAEEEEDSNSMNHDGPLNYSTAVNMESRGDQSPTVEFESAQVPSESDLETEPGQIRKQRFFALFKLRALLLVSNIPRFIFQIIFPLVFITGGVALLKFIPAPHPKYPDPIHLQASSYANVSNFPSKMSPNMLYYQKAPVSPESNQFVDNLRGQGLVLEQYQSTDNLLLIAPHMIGAEVNSVSNTAQKVASTLTVRYNTSAVHSIPAVINSFTTALLTMTGSASSIATYSQSWPTLTAVSGGFGGGTFGFNMLVASGLASIPPGFAVVLVKERVLKARSQLRLAGVTSNMYWATVFAFDGLQFFLACMAAFIILIAFQVPAFITAGAIISTLLLLVLYVPVNMLLAYSLGFMFNKFETAQNILPNAYVWSSLIPIMIVSILDFSGQAAGAATAHYIFCFLLPVYPLLGGFFYINEVHQNALDKSLITVGQYFDWNSKIPICFIMPIIHSVLFYYILRILDVRSCGGNWRDAFRCSESNKISDHVPESNTDIPSDEDEDVTAERRRLEEAMRGPSNAVIRVKNLRKEFPKEQKNGSCLSKAKKEKVRVAVRNTSFTVEPGEIVGLLGPNGAGKTTTLNMVIAETAPTKGKVFVSDHDVQSNLSEAFQDMGYCPQHDPLWDKITLRQHLECYAAVRGISSHRISSVIDYYVKSLRIKEHSEKEAKKLSGGTKRKLSYIISMLGDPKVVLMDEPSTGMDPKSKRFLWDTISAAFDNDRRGAILTTHYMDEADALCSRVAIMVNGQIECIGSTQRLKQRYGGGYLLEAKLPGGLSEESTENKMVELKQYIKEVFPGAQHREKFGDRVIFEIPTSNVESLSHTFTTLEKAKSTIGIEEYSFSQATLEQVFLEFAKHQLDEEEDRDPTALRQSMQLRRQLSMSGSSA